MKCLYCGKELSNYQTKYCSNTCQQAYQNQEYIKKWQSGEVDGRTGQFGISKRLRNFLLEKSNYQCEKCGWGEINPFTNTLPLEIHHLDGDYRNNQEDNLQVLCPNCHSLTATSKGANRNSERDRSNYVSRKNYCLDCGIEIASTSTRCHQCEAQTRKSIVPISREELKELIRTTPFTQIGKMYNVSDNTIRKWCDKYNLPRKATEIKAYQVAEWESI